MTRVARIGRINGVLSFPGKGSGSGDGADSSVAEGAAQPVCRILGGRR